MSDLREDVSVRYKGRKGSVDFIDVPSLLFALKVRGKHHETYLGDPRRSAPEKLRTLIRHPVV